MSRFEFAVGIALLALFGGWMTYHAIAALRTGIAHASGRRYHRSRNPLMFWLTVAVQTGFALTLLSLFATRIIRLH
jgi:hypothetical protein